MIGSGLFREEERIFQETFVFLCMLRLYVTAAVAQLI